MNKLVILGVSTLLLTGCLRNHTEKTDEDIIEFCYDGVVYIQSTGGYTNTSVKFKSDNAVATTMNNGVACKDTQGE